MENRLFIISLLLTFISCGKPKTLNNYDLNSKNQSRSISKIVERKYSFITNDKKLIIETHTDFNSSGKEIYSYEYRNYSNLKNPNLPLERTAFVKYFYDSENNLKRKESIDDNNKIIETKEYLKLNSKTTYSVFRENTLAETGEIIYNDKKQIIRETIKFVSSESQTQKEVIFSKVYDEFGNLVIDETHHINKNNESEIHRNEFEYINNLPSVLKNGLGNGTDIIYKYTFDSNKNWITKSETARGETKPIIITEREITYK